MKKFIVVMLAVVALMSASVVITAINQGSAFRAGLFAVFTAASVVATVLFAHYAGE